MPLRPNPIPHSNSLAPKDLANLRESGITEETISRNQLRTERKALVFPYRDIEGKLTGIVRRRPHVPRIDEKGREVKYEQPKGVPSLAYFPAECVDRLRESSNDIYVTEGEKKALALAQVGLVAIGLGGVWCGNKKGSEKLIDDLQAVNWKDRNVFIVFDYDPKKSTREQVDGAKKRLAKALNRAGASVVYSVALNPGPGLSKQGVDDYLVANGPDAFRQLVSVSKSHPSSVLALSSKSMSQKKASSKLNLAERLKKSMQSAKVEIGSGVGSNGATATMADASKLVAGIRWLVRGWVPSGMITGLIAEPGTGKSAFALFALARPIATGRSWFNGLPGPEKGFVLWCGTENDMAITIQRMNDWKIPLNQFVLPFADDPLRAVDLTDTSHLSRIEEVINTYKTSLVVVDSLRGGHGDDENNSRVGKVLSSLASIAERTNAAIVVVHHTRKLAVDEEITANSSRGSNAILAMMRSQIGIDKPDPGSKRCRVRVLKENLGNAPQPIGFEVTNKGLEFTEAPSKPRKPNMKDEAAQWLKNRMKTGVAYVASDLIEEAKANGHSERTTQKAMASLGIVPTRSRKNGKIGGWEWKLP